MSKLHGEVLTLPKMSGSVSANKSLSGNVGAKTINIGGRGDDGATFIPSVSADGMITWTNDKDLPNPEPVNIKGVKGDKGDAGSPGADGKDGQPGKDGADGVSPVVAVEDIDGGHRVTITDKDGTKFFDVMNGKDGVNTEGYSVILEMLNQHERRITALEQGNGNVDGTTAILGVATLGNMKLV